MQSPTRKSFHSSRTTDCGLAPPNSTAEWFLTWLGSTNFNVGMFFEVPVHWKHFHHIDETTGRKIARVSTSCWYTNLDHGRRHQPLSLMTTADNLRFSNNLRGKAAYDHYDNYDAIEVGTYKEIPSDYDGVMG